MMMMMIKKPVHREAGRHFVYHTLFSEETFLFQRGNINFGGRGSLGVWERTFLSIEDRALVSRHFAKISCITVIGALSVSSRKCH